MVPVAIWDWAKYGQDDCTLLLVRLTPPPIACRYRHLPHRILFQLGCRVWAPADARCNCASSNDRAAGKRLASTRSDKRLIGRSLNDMTIYRQSKFLSRPSIFVHKRPVKDNFPEELGADSYLTHVQTSLRRCETEQRYTGRSADFQVLRLVSFN